MTIASIDDYIASQKQTVEYFQNAGRAGATGNTWLGIRDLTVGQPGGLSSLATTGGLVTGGARNFPPLNTFPASGKGYLSRVAYDSSASVGLLVLDRLYEAPTFTLTSGSALSWTAGTPVDVTSRIPDGDATGCYLALEGVTGMSANGSLSLGYTNAAGVTGQVAPSTSLKLAQGQMVLFPLAAYDGGVRALESVSCTTTTITGAFNVAIVRPLWLGWTPPAALVDDVFATGLPEVQQTSALEIWVMTSSPTVLTFDMTLEIASK